MFLFIISFNTILKNLIFIYAAFIICMNSNNIAIINISIILLLETLKLKQLS